MKKYEYKVLQRKSSHIEGYVLSEFGKEGWELVSTHCSPEGHSSYYFKKEISYENGNNDKA